MYYPRFIDGYLSEWASRETHKPLLLRGARQVGKSTAVRHLAECFESYVEINFEKQASHIPLFQVKDIDVKAIVSQISAMAGKRIEPGKTLLFLDEVQACPESIMSLWFFKEDLPELHVEVVPDVDKFPAQDAQNVSHRCSPDGMRGSRGRFPPRAPACASRSAARSASGRTARPEPRR